MNQAAIKYYENGKTFFDSGNYIKAAEFFTKGIEETDHNGWDAALNFTGLSICLYRQAIPIAKDKGLTDSKVIELITASAREWNAALNADPRIEHFYADGIPIKSTKYDLPYFMEVLKNELAGCQKNA